MSAVRKSAQVVDIRTTAVTTVVSFNELWLGDRFQPAYAAGPGNPEEQPAIPKPDGFGKWQ